MPQPLLILVALIALATGLTACTDEPSQPESLRSYALGPGDEYVALGDSYTAAPGTGPRVTENGCFNTTVNYPHRVAEATGMTLLDNSCNGATTEALTKPQRTGVAREHAPQLDGVDADTDLVTIRLGANDYNMYFRIIACANRFGADAPGTPCADFDATAGENTLDRRLDDLRQNLDRALGEIQDRAPDARVLVIGYPRLVPDKGTCDQLAVPAGDYDYVRRIIEGLNTALRGAAKAAGLTYLDMFGPSKGHDICGDEPWIAGIGPTPTGTVPWHPYTAEAEAVAKLVLAELEEPTS